MTDLLALGIEQEGAHRGRGHIRPGHRPDCGWSNRGDTGRGGAWLRAGALHFSAIFVHTPAEVTLPVALQGHEVAQIITLGHILVIPGRATVVLQQVFPPALTDGPGPLGGLWWSAARWQGAGCSPRAGDFVAIGVHTPAEAGHAVTLQRQEVALLIALGDVHPAAGIGVLSLGLALLLFAGFQPRGGVRCALKSIPMIARVASAGEGARGIIAGS